MLLPCGETDNSSSEPNLDDVDGGIANQPSEAIKAP